MVAEGWEVGCVMVEGLEAGCVVAEGWGLAAINKRLPPRARQKKASGLYFRLDGIN